MDEIRIVSGNDIQWSKADIEFKNFAYYKEQAEKVAAEIDSLVLTEDNVQAVKKRLAQARKVTDGLNKRRIEIKKDILSDYKVFEYQVKELQKIIDDADSRLRSQVRDLEEKERQEKKKDLERIWDERVRFYRIHNYMSNPESFKLFLDPRLLNKSVPMKKCEEQMVSWLEQVEGDLDALSDYGPEYTVEYLNSLDLAETIKTVRAREEQQEAVAEAREKDEDTVPVMFFTVIGEKDIKLTEMLLKENHINYKRG
jgi:hypothetical protein